MKSFSSETKSSKNSHESGALSGWGLIGGAVICAIIGAFLGHWLVAGAIGAGLGWTVGAIVERTSRKWHSGK